MTVRDFAFVPLALLASLLWIAGCSSDTSTTTPVAGTPPAGGAHAHADEGPHGGHIVELGAEDYHAEVVDDDKSGAVTVYILGSDAKTAKPIEATEVTINIKHAGEGEQFKLAASPDQGDPQGKSSRFTLTDKHLTEDMHAKDADAQLVIDVEGKQLRGKIEGDHKH